MNGRHEVVVRVLGSLEACVADHEVAIPGTKTRALLTMLALRDGNAISAPDLAALLWGEAPPRTARKALQTYISAIRRALGERSVRTDGQGWRLAVASTDAAEFGLNARIAREAVDRDDFVTALAHFNSALDAWRGPPHLPETPLGDAERVRWSEAYDAIVDDRVDVLLRQGHAADLIGELESAVAATPLRERRWEQLCLAFYRAGRQGEALHAYRRARETLAEELGVEPGQALRQIESAILAHDPALDVRSWDRRDHAPPSRGQESNIELPTPPTTFVGRVDELLGLQRWLSTNRLVTVVGPGGVGKTRLAVAAAQEAAAAYPDGVCLVDLASADAGYLREAVAAGLGVFVPAGQDVEGAIVAQLRERRMLLLLDSCEHVVDEASDFAGRILATCPDVHMIATSREQLRASGEQVFMLRPLSMLGETTQNSKGSDAGTLFLDRVRAIDPEFDADADLIRQVCARCDGLPLAIELAAARCASLGIDGLLAGLDDHLRLLAGAHVRTARHRSLRAVLDWSHHLLDESEQTLFRRLSVFAGWFDLAAATVVADIDRPGAIDVIGRLTDKNLLVHRHEMGVSRWQMLDVVRSYARSRLAAAPDASDVQRRYIGWASGMAHSLESKLDVGDPWREAYDRVIVDLRSAMALVRAPEGPDVSEAPDEAGAHLTLTLALARLNARSGAFTLAQAAYELSMLLARATDNAEHLARAAMGASQSGMLFGVTRDGRVSLLEEAISAQGSSASPTRVRLLARLATELFWSGQRERSLTLAGEARELAAQLGDDSSWAHALYAQHYVTRRPDNWRERLELAEMITTYAARSHETQLELAGLAAHAVGQLEAGDLAGMAAGAEAVRQAADHLEHPEFQWYSAVYRLVHALIEGRFSDADELAVAARGSAVSAPEFAVGLFFAEAVTDLRVRDSADAAHFEARVADMARQFPRVKVWRCLQAEHSALRRSVGARAEARMLVDELHGDEVRDGHWLVSSVLLAETASVLGDADLAGRLESALLPFKDNYAVAGRVAAFRGPVSHALGLLALVRNDHDNAVHHFQHAVDKARRIGAHPFVERSEAALDETLGTG
jgi:predicted ATPase/DNA-binding SARP family transcriptional activator